MVLALPKIAVSPSYSLRSDKALRQVSSRRAAAEGKVLWSRPAQQWRSLTIAKSVFEKGKVLPGLDVSSLDGSSPGRHGIGRNDDSGVTGGEVLHRRKRVT